MDYDRDLRWARRATLLMGGVNAGMVIAHLLRREWWFAIVAGIWTVSLATCFRTLQINQEIRDQTRIVRSVLEQAQRHNDRLERGGLN
jgi:hypothetical protein